jgi:hypothetical protein
MRFGQQEIPLPAYPVNRVQNPRIGGTLGWTIEEDVMMVQPFATWNEGEDSDCIGRQGRPSLGNRRALRENDVFSNGKCMALQ